MYSYQLVTYTCVYVVFENNNSSSHVCNSVVDDEKLQLMMRQRIVTSLKAVKYFVLHNIGNIMSKMHVCSNIVKTMNVLLCGV